MIWEDEDLADSMWEARSAGLHIGTHANGDVAIAQVLKIYELLEERRPGMCHRIEHLVLPSPDQIARRRAIGAMAATQTVFLPAMGTTFRRYMREHFYARAYGVRSMLNAGLTVALSTDVPVVADDNPLLGLKSAINRRDHADAPLGPNQAITAAEALWVYTQAWPS